MARSCMRSPTTHRRVVVPGNARSVPAANSMSDSLKRPTKPWSEPKTTAPLEAAGRCLMAGLSIDSISRRHKESPDST